MILRRLYIYLVSAASLVVVAFGISGLGDTYVLYFLNDPGWQDSRTAIAGYGAAIIVGLPVWAIHIWIGRRFAMRDPAERASAIRHLYVYWACFVFALFFTINLGNGLASALHQSLDPFVGPQPPGFGKGPLIDTTSVPTAQSTWNALVLLVIWLLHYRMAARDRAAVGEQGASATLRRWYMYAALFIGFVLMLYSGAEVLKLLWAKVLGSNLYQYDSLSVPVSTLVTGFILWSFHARVVATRYLEDDRKSTLRAVEGFLAVGVSITLALYGGSQILYYSLARLIGVDNPGGLGNDILAGLADPGSRLIVFVPAWLLVRTRLSRDASSGEARRQAAIRRLYVNLASLVSLAAMAFGAGQVLWTLAEQFEAPMIGVSPFDWKNPLSIGVTLFAVGGAVWLAHWRQAPAAEERQSVSRRLYLWAALLGSVLAGLGFAVALVYSVLQQLLQQNPRLNDVNNLDFGHYLAALFVALVVGLYHWRVMRADTRARPPSPALGPAEPAAEPATPPWAATAQLSAPDPASVLTTAITASTVQDVIDLADWRRRVGDLYRSKSDDGIAEFRRKRDDLFKTHPQSPIEADERSHFTGLEYFAPDPAFRVSARIEPGDGDELVIDTGGEDGAIKYRRVGKLVFKLADQECSLTVLSLVQYAGGLFVPFKDATSGHETYGGGRYLFDTAKDTDGLVVELVPGSTELTIDFNYAYNPSCVYSPRWACPLAPPENTLKVAVRAGERMYEHPPAPEMGSGGPV
ncbi:MAG TPA: DUF5671 domain-containing protein [Candidatus Dormibacteraeota bacterium]|nr:DUF5671 domain-containing protein [Candidatus Dormibacteraeota bacterium]